MITFWHPLVYFASLLICVCLGNFYKRIKSTETKRNYGTGVGLLVACLICGPHILHTIFLVLGNAVIIRCSDKSYVHRISFMYSWLLLLYIQFNVKRSIYELWIFQVLTLRMVGMAFEVNLAYKSKFAQDSSKKTVLDLAPMKTLAEPSREHSFTSISTAGGSSIKEGRETPHTKADVSTDVRKETSTTEKADTTGLHQRNSTTSRSTHGRPSITGTSPSTVGRPSITGTSPSTAGRQSMTGTSPSTTGRINTTLATIAKKLSLTTEPKNHAIGRGETTNNSRPDMSILEGRRDSTIRLATHMLDSDVITKEPTAVDIISYAYFFIGLHKGPYYRWKTFDDHFYNTFGVLGDCRVITEHKLKKAVICSCAYILLRMKYDPNIYFQTHFYELYDTDFRYLYSVPQLLMFFLTHQIVMLLCTAVCTETGFGVYPAKTQPVPGHGPTASLGLLKLASTTASVAMEQEYNFSMLKCFENEKLFLGPRMADTMRSWEMATRYWFRAYAYKNFMKSNKEVRSAFTFLCWTVWLSPSIQQFIVSVTLWIYMHLEEEFQELYDTTGSLKLSWSMGFSIMRMMCLVYLTPCLVIENTRSVLRYYNSINWIFHIVLLSLIVYAIVVNKFRASNVV